MPRGHRLPKVGESPINMKYIIELGEIGDTRVNLNDCEAVEERCKRYFELCDKHKAPPTKAGLSTALGCRSNDALHERTMGRMSDRPSSHILQKYVSLIEECYNQIVLNGGSGTVGAIFLLKAKCGYQETTQHTIIHQNALSDGLSSPAELEQKYAELPVQDADFVELPAVDAEFEVLETE